MPDQISIILSLQRAYQHLIQIESSSMGLEGGGGRRRFCTAFDTYAYVLMPQVEDSQ